MAERDDMVYRLESEIRRRLLAATPLNALTVVVRGDPVIMPTKYYPFASLAIDEWGEITAPDERGHGPETGPILAYRYDGHLAVEVLVRDSSASPVNRSLDTPSYVESKDLVTLAYEAFLAWSVDGTGEIDDADVIVSADGKEKTEEFSLSRIRGGLLTRPDDNVSNRGEFDFTIWTRKEP